SEPATLPHQIPPSCHQASLNRADDSRLLSLLERAHVPARHTPTPGDSDSLIFEKLPRRRENVALHLHTRVQRNNMASACLLEHNIEARGRTQEVIGVEYVQPLIASREFVEPATAAVLEAVVHDNEFRADATRPL